MEFEMDIFEKDGGVYSLPVERFRTMNILGMTVVVKFDYTDTDGKSVSVQLALTGEQCRALSQQLASQADVLDLERPTRPQ